MQYWDGVRGCCLLDPASVLILPWDLIQRVEGGKKPTGGCRAWDADGSRMLMAAWSGGMWRREEDGEEE